MANTCHIRDQAHHARECSKKPILPEWFVQSALNGVEGKAVAVLTRGAYASYVSANAAKSGKSVSPKTAKWRPLVWRAVPAKPGNAAGGPSTRLRTSFFQHSLCVFAGWEHRDVSEMLRVRENVQKCALRTLRRFYAKSVGEGHDTKGRTWLHDGSPQGEGTLLMPFSIFPCCNSRPVHDRWEPLASQFIGDFS